MSVLVVLLPVGCETHFPFAVFNISSPLLGISWLKRSLLRRLNCRMKKQGDICMLNEKWGGFQCHTTRATCVFMSAGVMRDAPVSLTTARRRLRGAYL